MKKIIAVTPHLVKNENAKDDTLSEQPLVTPFDSAQQ